MVDAVAAYREAFSAYGKSLAGLMMYSGATGLLSAILFIASILVLAAGGVLSAGSANLFSSGGSLAAAGFSLTMLLVIIGGLVLFWIVSGINGAYFETVNFFLTGRRQTPALFFGAVPRRATAFFATGAIIFFLMWLPPAMLAAAAGIIGFSGMPIVSIALLVLGASYAAVVAILAIFCFPGLVADGRRPVEALIYSFRLSARNFISVVLYALIFGLLSMPALIPVFNVLYIPFFLMPIGAASLLSLYRRAR